jgi:hypothetical protein
MQNTPMRALAQGRSACIGIVLRLEYLWMPHGRSPTGSCAVPKERAPGRHFDALIKATAKVVA